MTKRMVFGLLLVLAWGGRAAAGDPQGPPEFVSLRQKFHDAIQPIAARKEQKVGDLKKEYALALEKGQKDIMATGDLDAALAFRAERERVLADEPTTAEQKKGMSRPLAALRSSYEKNLQRIETDGAVETQQVVERYLVNLQALEKTVTARGDLTGALQIRAERERYATVKGKPLSPAAPTAAKNLLPTMVATNQCEKKERNGGVVLTAPHRDMTYIHTQEKFKPPFVLKTRARTDSTNLRLYYANGMVIFNWEMTRSELRVHDPATGQGQGLAEKGLVSENKWHDIAWEIRADGMKISVDGNVRFEGPGDYSALEGVLGIGPAWGSVVSVDSFGVEPLTAE